MKKSSIFGWKEVFSFTLRQTLKNKAFCISFIIMLMISILSMPIISLLMNKDEEEKGLTNEITSVYVNNKSGFDSLDFNQASLPQPFSDIEFKIMTGTVEEVSDLIETKENTSVILSITNAQGMYHFDFIKPSKGPLSKDNVTHLSEVVLAYFETYRIETLQISGDQLAMLNATVDTKISMVDTQGVEIIKEDTSISYSEYWFIYGIFMVVLMVNTMASSQIAMSIVSDKSSKVVEYLLTSIKPMAIIVGKVLAMLTAVILQMVCLLVGIFASNQVTSKFIGNSESILAQVLPENILSSLNLGNVIICIVLIGLGFLFYATLAGLAGSTVSKMEEAGEGLTLFTIVNLVGAYIGIAAANVLMSVGVNGFVNFACLFPLSSPFILPGAIIVGKMSFGTAAVAIVLQLVFVILLFKFVAKVYSALILHSGNKIGIKQLFQLSKSA